MKFVFIGDAQVGKTALLLRMSEGRFEINTNTTIGL
jgi:GTPase SAR1 family protein